MKKLRQNRVTILALIAALAISNIGWVATYRANENIVELRDNSKNYPFLSKRIFAENQNDILINFAPLRKQLEAKFSTLPAGTQHSFYFEYLPSGTSIRVGSDNELVAASLIKVPLVMNLYHAAELGRINLDKNVTISNEELDNTYGNLWQKGPGTEITLRQAAKITLEESDNTASRLIFKSLRGLLSENEQSLSQLDVDQNTKNGQAVINAKAYTSVLKSLYFASYVNRESSQEILNFLAHSAESRRLTALLPKGTLVAHKNGVYNAAWAESDCGIVYIPSKPYALCVMIGAPEDQSNKFIAEVSKIVFDYVSAQK